MKALPPEVKSLLEAIDSPAMIMNRDYQVLASNTAYQTTYNVDPALSGAHCYEVSHGYQRPCDQEGESCPLKSCLKSREPERVLHIHSTPNGKEHIDVQLRPLLDKNGEIAYFLKKMAPVKQASTTPSSKSLVGKSPAFNRMLEQITRVAGSDVTVLLQGETGVGKEVVAKMVHEQSSRMSQSFATVECSGLSDSLFESELFGHVKGAFTGAINNKVGLAETATKGTLFLDEVGDIPLSQQVKLLRLIETGVFRPVGSVQTRHTDFRLICATHRNLQEMVKAGDFRQDLYYRLSTFPIDLPPLRERTQDIELLAYSLLDRIAPKENINFSTDALNYLQSYTYPGNIRELRNIVERANLLRNGSTITKRDLDQTPDLGPTIEEPLCISDIVSLHQVETQYLQKVSQLTNVNNLELAKALKISERTLYRKLQQL